MPHATPLRSAYVHVPFCRHRCGYCNFSVVAGRDDLEGDYLRAVELELGSLRQAEQVATLYFGGGTPTRLSPDGLARLCDAVAERLPLAEGGEWTVEANPADLEEGVLALLAERGVTRLSLGAQSFDAAKLQRLERDHRPEDIARCVVAAQGAGMQVSIDLIFAAPGETLDGWVADLDAATALAPDHVSSYGLTYEQGTSFWSRLRRGDLSQADEELERSMYLTAIDRLAAAGLEHYEVSNFARPGRRSRHNETYWTGREWWAFGPGAASFVGGVRRTNHRSTTTYLKRVLAGESPVAESEELTPDERARERLVFGLRRIEGVDLAELSAETGRDLEELAGAAIARFVVHGLLEREASRVRLTREGLLVSDALWPELL
ncbi:Oxygen-independent coproporphyrinogen-III oxidase-like protein [Pseudobythopirellula maris]|uniref:Heme chaperone HemW n=1 Tax=Pseudobythopirellula maris TaxID=2527991 RepID=A0A5C5ZMD6_9BACT|nr:radical SAM family heme chaperone HemW [Pseudobythopirellula maris]TWT88634.1 Oxygen-independent coproporphyrinogen-III oxidase-like protein [Pseudobythopirellula maris]